MQNIPTFIFIHYEPSYSNLTKSYYDFKSVYDAFRKSGDDNVTARVLSYFYEGMMHIIEADQFLADKKYNQAYIQYNEGNKLIVRSRASRGIEGDTIYHEMIKWTNYSEAMSHVARSYIVEKFESKINELEQSFNLFEEFNKLKEDENAVDGTIAKARFAHVHYLYYLYKSQIEQNSERKLKYLLRSRSSLQKADFIFNKYHKEKDKLRDMIDNMLKERIVAKAERFWSQGSVLIQESRFKQAIRTFNIASLYYNRASEICSSFMEQRLYLALSKITRASQLESQANELYRRLDRPDEASEIFQEAQKIVDFAIGMLATIESETLITSMTAQRAYYDALALQTKGIAAFDNDQYKEALENFNDAMKKLDKTQNLAVEGNIEQLTAFVRRAKSEIEGYLSMTKDMMI